MSCGYDIDDPRDAMIRENFDLKLYQEKPGKRPAKRIIRKGPRSVTLPTRQL